MGKKFSSTSRRLKRLIQRNKFLVAAALIGLVFVIGGLIQDKMLSVNPDSYKPLLSVIAHAESKGNYNAYFGNAMNTKVKFTDMTIDEVLQWQKEYVAGGSPSSAVGRYQFLNTTLAELVQELHIEKSQKFDAATQDRLAVALIERRGSVQYVNKQISEEDFAANLAMEWASLPKVKGRNPNQSYYAADGLNKSLVDKDEVLKAIDLIEPMDAEDD